MLKLKKRIEGYLKYPLMWVMLLWAFTLPGHEVKVYNFLLHALAGKPVADLVHAPEEVSRSEKQADFAYQEAAPTDSVGKFKIQLLNSVVSGFNFSTGKPASFISYSGYSYKAKTLKDQLLIALLPNAP